LPGCRQLGFLVSSAILASLRSFGEAAAAVVAEVEAAAVASSAPELWLSASDATAAVLAAVGVEAVSGDVPWAVWSREQPTNAKDEEKRTHHTATSSLILIEVLPVDVLRAGVARLAALRKGYEPCAPTWG